MIEIFKQVDLETETPEDKPATLLLVTQVYDAVKTAILNPIQEYDKTSAYNHTWRNLQLLDTNATTLKKTKTTVLQVDNEPHVPPKVLDSLVTDKVNRRFKHHQNKLSKNQP